MLAHIKPEDLMSLNDYLQWKKMEKRDVRGPGHCSSLQDENEERNKYERISCMAWTDLLLQLLKVGRAIL